MKTKTNPEQNTNLNKEQRKLLGYIESAQIINPNNNFRVITSKQRKK